MAAPSFFLELEILERPCEILFNGVPVLRSHDGFRIDTRIPITQFVVQGANKLEFLFILEDQDTVPPFPGVTATLLARAAPGETPQPVAQLARHGPIPEDTTDPEGAGPTPLGEAGPVEIRLDREDDIISISRTITINTPMPRWAFADSAPIPENDAVRESLVEWHRFFHGLLTEGQTDAIVALHAEKARELAQAYDTTVDAILGEIALPSMHENPEWRLLTPDWDNTDIELAADGRLVRLFDPDEGHLIVYRDDIALFWSFELWLRVEDGQWVIAR